MSWISKLQLRWKVGSAGQVILKPILKSIFGMNAPGWATVAYYFLILPIYNVILLLYGFIFGQFQFFWNFEKRLMRRIFSIFRKN